MFSNVPLFQVLNVCHQSFNMHIISLGSCIVRDASGNGNDTISAQFMADCTDASCKFGYNFTTCRSEKSCEFGLHNNFQVYSSST